jgi:nitric oxide dioxygenase
MGDVTLQPQTISTVKATAPMLREHGLEITQRMYQLLFQDERIKSLFNQSHHRGVGSQPRSLAGAVHAYAANIDRLEELGPVVERIAQKHVALNVLPEHYPAVGRALIGALRDILGQAATDEVIAAWTEAYGFLAQILMGREQELYDQTARAPGGWLGWREFVVDRVVPESEVITSYLRPRDGGPIMGFRPGQYLTFQLDIPGHGQVVRNYSASCAPGQDFYRISVKREGAPDDAPDAPAGLASNYLHDQASPGTVVRVSAPAGDFFLDEQGGRPPPRDEAARQGCGCRPSRGPFGGLLRVSRPRRDVRGRDYDEPGRITMDWLNRDPPRLFLRPGFRGSGAWLEPGWAHGWPVAGVMTSPWHSTGHRWARRPSVTQAAAGRGRLGVTTTMVARGGQVGNGTQRSRSSARRNWCAQGQRVGRCRCQRRAERVSRPGRSR